MAAKQGQSHSETSFPKAPVLRSAFGRGRVFNFDCGSTAHAC
jgi:hypothetical protein